MKINSKDQITTKIIYSLVQIYYLQIQMNNQLQQALYLKIKLNSWIKCSKTWLMTPILLITKSQFRLSYKILKVKAIYNRILTFQHWPMLNSTNQINSIPIIIARMAKNKIILVQYKEERDRHYLFMLRLQRKMGHNPRLPYKISKSKLRASKMENP